MAPRELYSVRTGKNKNQVGLDLSRTLQLFEGLFDELKQDGYLDEYLGSWCVDQGDVPGKIRKPDLDVQIKTRKDHLWPIKDNIASYTEDDLFDITEYIHTVVSKPIEGNYHNYSNCGMHWHTFNKHEGETYYRERVNEILSIYVGSFEINVNGEILAGAGRGFEPLFKADIPTDDGNIRQRADAAILRYRRHGSTLDDRRQAVRDLADVLEYVRPDVKKHFSAKDESDLFNIINNFGIRHHNERQKTGYDAGLWLSWMFYFFLSTIHLVLRKIEDDKRS
jgi:hypothetical protein